MTFGLAIEALKAGKRVARAGWNGNKARTGFVPQNREPVVYSGMGYIRLASGGVAIFDPEDFDLVSGQANWCLMGNGYPSFTRYHEGGGGDSRETVRLHELIMPGVEYVDHINGDKLDNRRRNLRPCSVADNNANRASVPGTSSRYKGVTWDKSRNKWMAAIAAGGKSKTIGRFESEDDAARAYDEAASAAYGEFARLNLDKPRMWLAMIHRASWQVDPAVNGTGGHSLNALPWIGMKTADECFVPWLASQTDMLADDWQIVE